MVKALGGRGPAPFKNSQWWVKYEIKSTKKIDKIRKAWRNITWRRDR